MAWLRTRPSGSTGLQGYERKGRSAEECQAGYRELFGKEITQAELHAIREATKKAWALGNDRFREKIAALADEPTYSRMLQTRSFR